MKIFLILLILTVSFTANISSQVMQQWVQRYNGAGNSNDNVCKVLVDKFTGNIYVTGTSRGLRNDDIVTVKYNAAGVQQWVRSYNGNGNGRDVANDMTLDNLGNLIITGYSDGLFSSTDIVTIKYDFNGNRIWAKRYNGTANVQDYGIAITTDGQGGIAVTGRSSEVYGSTSSLDLIIIKYSYNGTQEWVQRYNGSNLADGGYSVTSDGGNFYVTGYTFNNALSGDVITIKYSPQGNAEWIRKVSNPQNESGFKIINNFQASEIYTAGAIGNDIGVICYDYNGNFKWQSLSGGSLTGLTDAALDNNGTLLLCGNTILNGGIDMMVIAYNTSLSGGLSWYDIYDGGEQSIDYPSDITTDVNNNIYLTGYSIYSLSTDCITVKYSISGQRLWEKRYNFTGSGENLGVSVFAANDGSVYVAASSKAANMDYATIKYTQSIFRPGNDAVPSEFILHQNYPNPFNPSTQIKYDLPLDANVKITVFDMLGKEIAVLVNEHKAAGSYDVSFNATQLSSGMYFYRIETGSFTETKKMLLVK